MRSMLETLFPSNKSERTISAFSIGRYMPSRGFSCGSRNVLEHWRHWNRCVPLRSRPLRLHSIRQLWQVTMKSPIEFHSLKPDNEIASPVSYTHLRAHETGRNLVCRL